MTANTQAIWFLNSRVEVICASADHPCGVSVLEMTLPFGDSPPLHRHDHSAEVFHILEGVVRFQVGERSFVGRAGETFVGPALVPHSFRVESETGARWIVTTYGPDFEQMIREFGRPAAGPGLPDQSEVTPRMAQALGEVAARHNIELLGPPLAA